MTIAGDRGIRVTVAGTGESYLVGGVRLARPFSIERLGHVGLYQRRLDEAVRFYRDLLGLMVTDRLDFGDPDHPLGTFLTYGADHHALVLIDASVGQSRDDRYSRGVTLNQLSFQVGSLREVVEGHRYLSELGATIWRVGRDVPGSNFAVYAHDPDGFPVELFYGMEQLGWQRRAKPPGAAHLRLEPPVIPAPSEAEELADFQATGGSWEPVNVDPSSGTFDLSRTPGDVSSGAFDVGGIMLDHPFKVIGMGPVAIFVRDVEASCRWYRDVYGFSLTEEVEYGGSRCAFLRIGNDHHDIALIPIELRAELGFPTSSTLMTVGLRLGSYAQLRDAVAFLRSAHVDVDTRVPHELHPGIEEAAYVVDPSGHRVLLYCAMEQIGWDGNPRPAIERRSINDDWPAELDVPTATFTGRHFQGPLG